MRIDMMEIEMFIGMFVIQYVFSSFIMTDRVENITNSLGKVYMCTIMGFFMVLLGMAMNPMFSFQRFSICLILLILTIILYKIQFGIDDKNYLRGMIEHHSMAILTSQNIIEKTKNPAVANMATRILTTQKKEIEDMKYLLKSI
jgi:hypothetical protein